MKFKSGLEMYEFVAAGNDLYNPQNGLYVFVYNDADALCCYVLDEDTAKNVARQAEDCGEYWGAFLSTGGYILDDLDYNKFRYAKDSKSRRLYLKPSFDFCETYFQCNGWILCDEFLERR